MELTSAELPIPGQLGSLVTKNTLQITESLKNNTANRILEIFLLHPTDRLVMAPPPSAASVSMVKLFIASVHHWLEISSRRPEVHRFQPEKLLDDLK